MPAHAMWRQAGQKVSAALTGTIAAAARQARLGATTLERLPKTYKKL